MLQGSRCSPSYEQVSYELPDCERTNIPFAFLQVAHSVGQEELMATAHRNESSGSQPFRATSERVEEGSESRTSTNLGDYS